MGLTLSFDIDVEATLAITPTCALTLTWTMTLKLTSTLARMRALTVAYDDAAARVVVDADVGVDAEACC